MKDKQGCRTVEEVTKSLGLLAFKDRQWHVHGCSAITGKGLKEGFIELSKMIRCFRQNGPMLIPLSIYERIEREHRQISENCRALGL